MAYSTHPTSFPFGTALRSGTVSVMQAVGTFFVGLNHSLMKNSAAHLRLEQVERLQAKTDEELAALHIKREDIVQLVFRDFY